LKMCSDSAKQNKTEVLHLINREKGQELSLLLLAFSENTLLL
jgi:hypothetical protein